MYGMYEMIAQNWIGEQKKKRVKDDEIVRSVQETYDNSFPCNPLKRKGEEERDKQSSEDWIENKVDGQIGAWIVLAHDRLRMNQMDGGEIRKRSNWDENQMLTHHDVIDSKNYQ